jgi:hypothetical protein
VRPTPVSLSIIGPYATSAYKSDILSLAIWDVFDPGTGSGQELRILSASDRHWVSQVLTWASSQTNHPANGVGLGNFAVYTPNPGSESDKSLGTPQEFIGSDAAKVPPSLHHTLEGDNGNGSGERPSLSLVHVLLTVLVYWIWTSAKVK